MIFFNHLKNYIFFIILIELVKFSLSSEKNTLPEGSKKKSSRRKNHLSRTNSKKNSKKERKSSDSRQDRIDKLRKQLKVGSYAPISRSNTTKKQSSVVSNLQKLNELRSKSNLTSGYQNSHGSRRHFNPPTEQLNFKRPYRRPPQRTRQAKSPKWWSCFG